MERIYELLCICFVLFFEKNTADYMLKGLIIVCENKKWKKSRFRSSLCGMLKNIESESWWGEKTMKGDKSMLIYLKFTKIDKRNDWQGGNLDDNLKTSTTVYVKKEALLYEVRVGK